MVRLRVGRFAWELYYTKTPPAIPREALKRRLGLVLGHAGYVTGLCEYIMTDMLWLRGFAVMGCTMIVGFQMVQPRVQWISVFWNSVFTVVNLYQMHLLVQPAPEPSEAEAALLEAMGNRFSSQQLRTLALVGSWRFFDDGDVLCPTTGQVFVAPAGDDSGAVAGERSSEGQRTGEGSSAALAHDKELYLVASGNVSVRLGPLCLGELGPGDAAGELDMLLGKGHDDEGFLVARGRVLCLCLPKEPLDAALRNDLALRGSLQGIVARSLAAKVAATSSASGALQYGAVLDAMDGIEEEPAMAAALERFRQRHGVSQETQERARQLAAGESGVSLGLAAHRRRGLAAASPNRDAIAAPGAVAAVAGAAATPAIPIP